ncbi:MAG: PHP domain-containing protein, partial [Bacteroidota bacterium]
MILNAHSYYSLRYGVIPIEELVRSALENGYEAMALTDINNSTGALEFVRVCNEKGLKPLVGMEFRKGDELLCIAIARNKEGFREINEVMSASNLQQTELPSRPDLMHCYVIYPYGNKIPEKLRDYEYVGIKASQLKKLVQEKSGYSDKFVILLSCTFQDFKGFETHKKLRAVDHNILLSQLESLQIAATDEFMLTAQQ